MRYVVVILAALATAQSAWAAPAPLRVTGISPQMADRGELVTITGGGFGAHNLEVSVGGERVPLVSATGSKASFRVPALGAVGDVSVEARNPGGHAGRIGLTVRFDGHTAAAADESAAVSVPLGAEGGTIAVEGMELAIPAGAVPEGTTITATPLRSLQGAPFVAAPVGLKLEPSGLVLLQPATLTLPRPAGAGQVIGFGFNGEGESFHLVPHRAAGDTVELKVWHFSGAGALTARLDELEAALSYEPAPAHELAEQRIAAALVDAQVNGSDPGPAIFVALRNWRSSSVSQGLQIAGSTTRLDFFELAFGEWLAWLAYLQEYRDTIPAADASFFDTATALDRNTATVSAAAVARRQLDRCVGPDLPRAAVRDVLRVASAVNLADLPIETAEDPGSARPLPTARNLPTACLDVVVLGVEHAATMARNRDNRFTARAHVEFWSGDPSTSIPLRYRLVDNSAAPLPVSSGTTSNGAFATTVRPSALGVSTYELTVDFGDDSILSTFFHQTDSTVPVRDRVELQGRRVNDAVFTDTVPAIGPGNGVVLRIRLAGDDVASVPVALTHDGGGLLPISTTTDANGAATVTYTAPAADGSELVTATITDSGITVGDAIVLTTRPAFVVTVTPSFGFVGPGETIQFTATVSGTADQRVNWNASGGGSIDSSGRFTAGPNAGVFNISATSFADLAATGVASIQVVGEDATGDYVGDMCSPLNGLCLAGSRIGYSCGVASRVGPGTVCALLTSANGWLFGNLLLAFCTIETNGTITGGPFTGRITFCSGSQVTDRMRDARIEGSIADGRLRFTVYGQFFEDPDAAIERFDGRKV
jgi:IPT/TIG domain